jgi:uncharacterized membrane protein
MEFTNRETWTLIHGLILGTFFLLAFAGGLAGLWSLRTEYVTPAGISERLRLAGEEGAGCEGLQVPGDECSPRDFLLSNVSGQTEDWHKFGMEWKEHIAWLSPMLATLAAFLVFYYGPVLARNRTARMLVLVVFTGAFAAAAIAGLFGALITKTAPIT